MWIQVRSFDGRTSVRVDDLSKLTKIEELREKLVDPFGAPPERQRLFYRGKQLVDDHTLFDYNVGLNEVIQIMVRPPEAVQEVSKKDEDACSSGDETSDKENKEPEPMVTEPSTSEEDYGHSTYKVGDIVDCRDPTMGAWFEAQIVKITLASNEEDASQNTQVKDSQTKETIKDESSNQNGEISAEENKVEPLDNNNQKESGESDNVADKSPNQIVKDQKISDNDGENATSAMTGLTNGHSGDEVPSADEGVTDDEFVYHIKYEGYEEDEPEKLRSRNVRPRCCTIIPFKNVNIGDRVMINYNYDEPQARGYWYDAVITEKRDTRTIKELHATVFLGADLMPLKDCKLLFIYEVYAIEKAGTQKNVESNTEDLPKIRPTKPECDFCLDKENKKCKECGCHKCGGKNEPNLMIMCDECDMAYHLGCLDPPLDSVPDVDEWYCPLCKTDTSKVVKAGEKLKDSKKKAKMASQMNNSSRDWGKGMACAGRTKMCTIVPPNHFGPIPGIEVGSMWKFRVQASEAGVHRPHVAGIHGREDEGSYSIVLSGGYEDDVDDGDSFTYTGSGGRDLSGNKRTAEQSCDQTLTRMNKALAKNCNAPLDNKKGAEAKDWRAGKAVRVIRNCKGRKHSKYAPEEGNRYDGIYKIVKYWPDKGKSGFIVWRYLLRRDDPTSAPWTKAGKKRIAELGLTMQYPEGYLESQKEKEEAAAEKGKGKGKKRKAVDSDSSPGSTPEKKKKVTAYRIADDVKKLIVADQDNKKIWDEALPVTKEGGQKFLAKVEELLLCICCQDIVNQPITTKCSHNICKSCLGRSFKADVYNCPACRTELGKGYSMATNQNLKKILNSLFPGYEAGR